MIMKKAVAILLSSFMLISGMKVSMGRHYCGGELAGIKLSLTGKLASCGMEDSDKSCSSGQVLSQKCCEDKVTSYNMGSKYVPEYSGKSHVISLRVFTYAPDRGFDPVNDNILHSHSWSLPPGTLQAAEPVLSQICVFRI